MRILPLILLAILAGCGSSPKTAPEAKQEQPAVTGSLDAPVQGTAVKGTFIVGGWAVSSGSPLTDVLIFSDGRQLTTAAIGGARPDVAKALPALPNAATSGFTTTVDTASITPGKHELEVKAKLADGSVHAFAKATITAQ